MRYSYMLRLVFLICLLTVFNCQYTEVIHIASDGSGTASFSVDASELMTMAGDELLTESEGKSMDSTVVFREFLELHKDSIVKLPVIEQQKLKVWEPYELDMKVDYTAKQMKFDLRRTFEKLGQLKEFHQAIANLNGLQDETGQKNPGGANPFSSDATQVTYTFKDNVFNRTAKIVKPEVHQQLLDSLVGAEMVYAASVYTLKYHFYKPIKKVSNEMAVLSADRKSLTLDMGVLETIKDPALLDLEVILE